LHKDVAGDASAESGDDGQAEHADQVVVIGPAAARFERSGQSTRRHAGELDDGEDGHGVQIDCHAASSLGDWEDGGGFRLEEGWPSRLGLLDFMGGMGCCARPP
jgi:hypothetical protein